jgi:hypothetical protein
MTGLNGAEELSGRLLERFLCACFHLSGWLMEIHFPS